MLELPSGTVTLLFTDIEGSTRLLRELGAEAYADALAEHRRVVRDAFQAHGGVEVDTQGDAFFVAFPAAPGALAAAAQAQAELAIPVRMGVHTGTPLRTGHGYVGMDVNVAARIAAAGHGGQVLVSATTRALADGFDLHDLGEHRFKDVAPIAVFQLGEGMFPPLKTISNTNLPRPASSFVGRAREVTDVVARVSSGARLLTLTGPGGSGKTRLALEAAASLVPEYRAGVFWIGLAALRDPTLVTETVAQTLGAPEGLPEHIGEREMLLLLDNLEQVIDAGPELARLLESCPNLTLLVTSRELLRVRGEIEYPVPTLAESEAVELFCERAQLDPSDDIRELCRRLDSLPLAVELAAARTKALSPRQILDRLARRLDLLRGGRDADPRQRTLRATVEWSHSLLPDEEVELFRRFSVFADGCTLEAAQEVCGADVDGVQSLVEKNLLRRSDERYWMLETIREFAREQLEVTREASELRRRHAEYFRQLAESLGLAVEAYESGRAALYEIAIAEQNNLRAAIAWGMETNVELGLRIAVALEQFWVAHNPFEGARTFEALLADADRLPLDLLAAGLRCYGGSLTISGDLQRAGPAYERSLDLYEQLGDEWGIVHLKHRRATTALSGGDWVQARSLLEDNLIRARSLGSRYLEGEALSVLSLLVDRDGDPERAAEMLVRSLEIAREVGFRWREAIDLGNLAELLLKLGRPDEAEENARAAVALSQAMDDRLTTVTSLATLAQTARARGDTERAGRLWGAIEAEETRAPLGRWEQYREEFAASVVDDSAEFEHGRNEGRLQSLDAAVERALEIGDA